MKRIRAISIIVLITVLITSCSSYEKVLKSKDYDFKYVKALEYYVKGDYFHSTALFEQLSPIFRGTQRSDTIEYYLAVGNYHQGDFLLAAHYFDKFRKTYPRSGFTEDAEFMYAYCYYQVSPRPELDQENTQFALGAFSEFLSRYPNTERLNEVSEIMVELRNKLIDKAYLSAKLYYTIGEYKAAIIAFKNSLKDYPMSKYREEQLYLIVKSSFLLADNSVPQKRRERFQATVDEYFTFIGEFPESEYLRDAKRMYDSSLKILGKQNN